MNGNTFDSTSTTYTSARKVWREIQDQYPCGGIIENPGDWSDAGKIPAGTPCKIDLSSKEVTAYTDDDILDDSEGFDITSLGINGFLQEDVLISGSSAVATGTVVYRGELYSYMLGTGVPAAVAGLVPGVVFVQ